MNKIKNSISKIDLIILKELKENKKTNYIQSESIYNFKILEVVSYNAIYKRIQHLKKIGYVEKGLKNGKKNTYFVTNLGIEMLEKI